jgi:hypothetical protein
VELLDPIEDREVVRREDYQTAPAIAENTPVINEPQDGQSPVQLVVAIVAGIIIVILLVLLGRWIYHEAHKQPDNKVTITSGHSSQSKGARPSGGSASNNSSTSSNSGTTSNPSGSAPNNSLPNSGPGNVALIFAASAAAAAGLHYIISLRRTNKN